MSRQNYHRLFANYPEIASLHEVQQMLGVSRNAAFRLSLDHQVAAIHIDGRIFFLKSSVIDFVKQYAE